MKTVPTDFLLRTPIPNPEEDLPASNSIVECDGVVFRFPDKSAGRDNNISLEGQRISIPEDLYDTAYFLGASEEISLGENIRFTFSDGGREEAFLGAEWMGLGPRARIRGARRDSVLGISYLAPCVLPPVHQTQSGLITAFGCRACPSQADRWLKLRFRTSHPCTSSP